MKRIDLKLLVVVIVFAVLPFVLPDYYNHVFILTFFFAYLAHSWSILGDAGQVSMGHSVFSGIGAYLSLVLFIRLGITPWIGMWIAASVATCVGLFIGYLSFRYGIRELYFILVTLAFSQIFVFLAINTPFVGGPNGLSVPVKPGFLNYQFTQKYVYYYVIFFLFVASMVIRHVIHSRKLGHYLAAIRENEEAAQAVGVHLMKYKLIALAISAFLTSLGGTFYVQYISYIDPVSALGPEMPLLVVVCVIVGGNGTLWGPTLGAFLLIPFGEFMRLILHGKFPALPLMLHGLLLIVVIIFLPRGMMNLIELVRTWGRTEQRVSPNTV
jgi:branched-chain amino acid transport system permease protein